MDMVTEDNRKERGDYDDFFKIKKKEHQGTIEERMANLEQDLKDYQELLEVFVQALIHRGWSTRAELEQRWQQLHEERPWAGGMIVAKAWTDPAFKRALLSTGREALREMGVHQGKVGKLVVVENTDKVHNVYAPVIPTTFLAIPRGGTSTRATGRKSCRTRGAACRRCSAWKFPRGKKFRCTIARPTFVILSCRSALRIRKECRRRTWPNSSPSIA
jgi:hypothetical protein